MDEKQFMDALDIETNDRLNYANMLGDLKTIFMDMADPIFWLHGAYEHWDELNEDDLISFKESLHIITNDIHKNMGILLGIIQNNAKYLFGEEFSSNSFHTSDCNCDHKGE